MQLYIRMYVDREREGDVCIYVYRERVTYGPWGQARPLYVGRSLSSSLLRVGQAVIDREREREGERERERERERDVMSSVACHDPPSLPNGTEFYNELHYAYQHTDISILYVPTVCVCVCVRVCVGVRESQRERERERERG